MTMRPRASAPSEEAMNPNPDQPVQNTDRELWRERPDDYYAPSLFVTESGGIGINVGGTVFVKPVAHWHMLARLEAAGRRAPSAAAIDAAYAVSERREGEARTASLIRALRAAYAVDFSSGAGAPGAPPDNFLRPGNLCPDHGEPLMLLCVVCKVSAGGGLTVAMAQQLADNIPIGMPQGERDLVASYLVREWPRLAAPQT